MSNYSFFIGIDVSKSFIDVSYYFDGASIYLGEYRNSKKGFKLMIRDLASKTEIPINKWFICFENTGSYSKEMLYWFNSEGIPSLEENPIKLSRSLGLRRGKNDKADSKDICRYAFEKRDIIQPGILPRPLIIKLKSILSRRNLYVKQRTALKVSLKEQKPSMDPNLYKELNAENEETIAHYNNQIKRIEDRMEQLIQSDPDLSKNSNLLQSIIGIGSIISANLIATTNNFESFTCARKYACYCGIAPFSKSSGIKKGQSKVNHIANKKIKSLLSNSIPSVVAHDPEMSIYYKRKIEEGKKPGIVSNAIKNKLIHRAFAVVKRETPFVKMMTYT